MEEQKKRVTIKDIAQKAGVSFMTVSLALNNKPGISQATRKRIMKIAKEMRYIPNSVARSLNSQKTYTIGVVTSNTSAMVFSRVWRGIEEEANKAGYSTIMSNTDEIQEKERQAIDVLLNKRVDGVLLIAPILTSKEDLGKLYEFNMPFVLLLRQDPEHVTDSCLNDNYQGAYSLVDYLISTNSRKFLYLSLLENIKSGQERMKGYCDAMADHNMSKDECKIIRVEDTIDSGYKAMKGALANGLQWDTVVCGCDMIAVGAIKALNEAKIKIPQQVRVVGYDDIELSQHLSVPLTTIHQPYEDIGRIGMQILLERIKNPGAPHKRVILQSELIMREST